MVNIYSTLIYKGNIHNIQTNWVFLQTCICSSIVKQYHLPHNSEVFGWLKVFLQMQGCPTFLRDVTIKKPYFPQNSGL